MRSSGMYERYARRAVTGVAIGSLIVAAVSWIHLSNARSVEPGVDPQSPIAASEDVAPQTYSSRVEPIEVTAGTFDERVLNSRVPVLVDFYADWCGPCQVQGRILDEFAREVEGFTIVKVNVDDSGDLAERYQIEALPTLLVFMNGRVISQLLGVSSKKELKSALGG